MATMVIPILKACVPLNGMADWNVDKRDSQVYTRHSDYNVLNEPGACACHRLGSPGKGHIHTVGYSTPSWLGDLGKLLALSGPQFFTWKVGTMMAPTEKIKL